MKHVLIFHPPNQNSINQSLSILFSRLIFGRLYTKKKINSHATQASAIISFYYSDN